MEASSSPNISKYYPRFHYFALRNGATIIPSCGLDSMPSDIAVYLSSKALKEISPDALIDTSTTAFKVKGGASGGTLATAFSSLEEVPKAKREAAKKDYILSPGARTCARPSIMNGKPTSLFHEISQSKESLAQEPNYFTVSPTHISRARTISCCHTIVRSFNELGVCSKWKPHDLLTK